MKFIKPLKLNKATEGDGAPKAFPMPPQNSPQAQADGNQDYDDHGYAVPSAAAEGAPNAEGKAAPEPKPAKAAAESPNPTTGYGSEPPKVDPVAVAAKPLESPTKVDDLGFELKDDGIPKSDAQAVREFAKKHSLTKEVAQELLDQKKAQFTQAEADRAAFEQEQIRARDLKRSEWYNELKNDPTFGGEKFAFHVKQAEKVIEEFMPGTKKTLTERGSMLPPYIMRDLAKLAAQLYTTDSLMQGQPVAPSDDQEEDDGTAFYGMN